MIDAATSSTSPTRRGLGGVIAAATVGNVLEWFDFLVYGFFAVQISEAIFPDKDPNVSLLITFGTFGLSYLVRPLGAMVIGGYTDRAGRKAGLTLSIGLMMIGTLLMVVTPGYASIGVAAPAIIILARLLQGFSVGGEFGSAVAFLAEHSGDRRGYGGSWQFSTVGMTSIIASLFGLVLSGTLSHDQLVAWGWRVPYVFGLLIGPAGLYIRSRVAETPDFILAKKPPTMPIGDLLRKHPVAALLALGVAVISNSSYYLLLYIPTYGVKTLHLPASTTFAATLVGGIILAVFSLVAGHWSDRMTPRARIMLICAWGFLLLAYPCFWLMAHYPSMATAMFAVGLLNLIKSGYSGVLPAVIAEQFPVETRAVGVAFCFSMSVTIFGGFAPFVATWLIKQTGDPLSPSYYMMVTAILSIIALTVIVRQSKATAAASRS